MTTATGGDHAGSRSTLVQITPITGLGVQGVVIDAFGTINVCKRMQRVLARKLKAGNDVPN
jgi:hypothetical protein